MNGTRKHPNCKTCGQPMPAHLSHSARHCSKQCIYRNQANKDGRKPMQSTEARFWEAVKCGSETECWEWQASRSNGYGVISINGRGGGMKLTHRYSYELANGPIPDGGQILHSCDNPPCVNPAHLSVGDHDANMEDMARKERGGKTKLTATQVIEIRDAYTSGENQKSIARRFNISQSNVAFITARKTWRHVA